MCWPSAAASPFAVSTAPPAVAFPQYADAQEAPQLPGATALLFERAAPGVAVSQWSVPGEEWAGLQPGTRLRHTVEAAGDVPGGGAYAAVKLPQFEQQLPAYGSHWPIRVMPALFALGANTSSGAGAGGMPPSPPAAAGTLTIPASSGDVQDVVWRNATSAGAARQRPAALAAAALLVGAALCSAL